jgi:hypothetical protein
MSMKIYQPQIRGMTPGSFRCGEWANLLGVVVVVPGDEQEPRVCWHVTFKDGESDYWTVTNDYEMRPAP